MHFDYLTFTQEHCCKESQNNQLIFSGLSQGENLGIEGAVEGGADGAENAAETNGTGYLEAQGKVGCRRIQERGEG
jgi:hypothetical protein